MRMRGAGVGGFALAVTFYSIPTMEAVLRNRAVAALEEEDLVTATALAQYVWEQSREETDAVLLAHAEYRAHRYTACYLILRHLELLYQDGATKARRLFALSCLQLKKYKEGIAMFQEYEKRNSKLSSFEIKLLADLYAKLHLKEAAVEKYHDSLMTDPLCWSAIKELSSVEKEISRELPKVLMENNCTNKFEFIENISILENRFESSQESDTIEFNTPSARLRAFRSSSSQSSSASTPIASTELNFETPMKQQSETLSISKAASYKIDATREARAQSFSVCAEAYRLMKQYRLAEAMEKLSLIQNNSSSWILNMLGMCYFEKSDYEKALEYFEQAVTEQIDLEYLPYYSSALWQLRKTTRIASLCHEITTMDIESYASSWIAFGNCFSLRKDHETALKYFKKAITCDSSCAYAYSLTGHELVAMGTLEPAIAYYRKALVADDRHYIAWYGLGNVYLQQKRYEIAAHHFRKAIDINSENPVLRVCLGVCLLENNHAKEALVEFDVALDLQSTNIQAKFHRAKLYTLNGNYHFALRDLEEVIFVAPREAIVHLLLGQIYKELNQIANAIEHYTISMALDPKEKTSVEPIIEQLKLQLELN